MIYSPPLCIVCRDITAARLDVALFHLKEAGFRVFKFEGKVRENAARY